MAIKRIYVSDITGNDLVGKPKSITLQRSVTKKNYYGSYRTNEHKSFHIGENELDLLPESIREWLFPVKETKATTKKKVVKA